MKYTIVLFLASILVLILVPIFGCSEFTATTQVSIMDSISLPQTRELILRRAENRNQWTIILCIEDFLPEDNGYIRFYKDIPDKDIILRMGNKTDDLVDIFDDRTLVILFTNAERNLEGIPKSHIIGMSHEPNMFTNFSSERIEFVQRYCSMFLVGDAVNLSSPYSNGYTFICSMRKEYMNYTCDKSNIMSLMVSEKQISKGHKYRHNLAEKILELNLPVDIYGRGSYSFKNQYPNDMRLKGPFQDRELYQNYQFTIAIENVQESHYISEKFTNSLVHDTIPLYLGSPKITSFFGENSCIAMSGDLDKDILLISDICQFPEKYLIDLSFAKNQLEPGGSTHLLTFLRQKIIPNLG